jgi:hypothetical protein
MLGESLKEEFNHHKKIGEQEVIKIVVDSNYPSLKLYKSRHPLVA